LAQPLEGQQRLTLPPTRRLRLKTDFEAVYSRGQRLSDASFNIVMRANELGAPRIGLAVSVKSTGNSVVRNRIRRLIRESFRLRQDQLPAVDIVVSMRGKVREIPRATLRASLDALWDKVIARCATSSSR
jgi:ribonuclease P protein component